MTRPRRKTVWITVVTILVIWYVISFCLPSSRCRGAEVPAIAKPYSLVRVKLETGERCFVLAQDLMPVDYVAYDGGVVFTGPPGRYAVLAFTPASTQSLITTIGEAPPPIPPVPPPTPPKPLTGLALAVFEHCPATSATNATRLAANFRIVSAEIVKQIILVPEAAIAHIKLLNSSQSLGGEWPAFGGWLGVQLSANSVSLDQIRAAFDAIAEGLEARAK